MPAVVVVVHIVSVVVPRVGREGRRHRIGNIWIRRHGWRLRVGLLGVRLLGVERWATGPDRLVLIGSVGGVCSGSLVGLVALVGLGVARRLVTLVGLGGGLGWRLVTLVGFRSHIAWRLVTFVGIRGGSLCNSERRFVQTSR